MKTCNLSVPVLGVLLTLTTMTALCDETAARVPDTAAARAAANVIARAERAVTTYVDACVAHDAQRLNRVTTRDARVEYTLANPGIYLSMDASSLIAACAAAARKSGSIAANFWIFPTNDADTVFVQYDAPSDTDNTSHRQLALVEMRGDQISRMLNFAAMPPAVVASTLGAAAASVIADSDEVVSNTSMKPHQCLADPAVRRQIIEYLKSNRDLLTHN
jgi:hypothetical protein